MSASKSLYDIKINSLQGKSIDLLSFKGKKVLFVNVASKCGFTPQYEELEEMQRNYKEDFFVIWNIFKNLYPKNKYFKFKEIINSLLKNPKILKNNYFL